MSDDLMKHLTFDAPNKFSKNSISSDVSHPAAAAALHVRTELWKLTFNERHTHTHTHTCTSWTDTTWMLTWIHTLLTKPGLRRWCDLYYTELTAQCDVLMCWNISSGVPPMLTFSWAVWRLLSVLSLCGSADKTQPGDFSHYKQKSI